MLFNKQTIDEETRRKYVQEIDRLVDQGKKREALEKTKELEAQDRDAAGYYMAYFYHMGEVLRENEREALKRLAGYIDRFPDDRDAYLLLGDIQVGLENDAAAVKTYEKAIRMGSVAAMPILAGLYKIQADQLRNQSARSLNPVTYAANTGKALSLYISSMDLYRTANQRDKDLLDDTDWQGYGRILDTVYAMSLNGEVKEVPKSSVERAGILGLGASIMAGKADVRTQEYWRGQAVEAAARMEAAGYAVAAEYFRASLCMSDCEKKKQEMLLNAIFHMDRAQALSGTLTAQQRGDYPSDFGDIIQQYNKLNGRLGKAMQNRLRAGELPRLELDYPADSVPTIESNPVFAEYLARARGGRGTQAPVGQAAPQKKKGLFGRFF